MLPTKINSISSELPISKMSSHLPLESIVQITAEKNIFKGFKNNTALTSHNILTAINILNGNFYINF